VRLHEDLLNFLSDLLNLSLVNSYLVEDMLGLQEDCLSSSDKEVNKLVYDRFYITIENGFILKHDREQIRHVDLTFVFAALSLLDVGCQKASNRVAVGLDSRIVGGEIYPRQVSA
jgi:hypothetical protein